MMNLRSLFLQHVAQTSELPMMLDVVRAEGVYLYDAQGDRYIDFNSGISVSSLGHGNHAIVQAVQSQSAAYMHTMVYGEHVQAPQVRYAEQLTRVMGAHYESLYYLMSGTEAVELAMKLAKRYTGRAEIVACRHAYHGSTHGAESLRSDLDYKLPFMPLVPGIKHIDFNSLADLEQITKDTAAVICEAVQAEAGIICPMDDYLKALQSSCREVGALFILDEIQTGFGRTGQLFAHQKYNVKPDVVLIGKAMGGGMPLAGVVSSRLIMSCLVKNPMLGHITTFGGHPVCCAAAEAALDILLSQDYISLVYEKEIFLREALVHPLVKEIRSSGLMMAVELIDPKYVGPIVQESLKQGVMIDYFLFNDRSFRIAPPLVISKEEIIMACANIRRAMDVVLANN